MKFIAVKHVTNTLGIGITEIDAVEDTVSYAWSDEEVKVETAKIHYDEEDAYFFAGTMKMYLDEFIRT